MAFTLAALDAIGFGAQVYGAFSKDAAYHSEAGLTAAQGVLSYNEAVENANIIRNQGKEFASKQEMQFIAAGVIYGGSDLVTTTQTKMFAEQKAQSVEARGRAIETLDYQKAQIENNEGTASLIGGLASSIPDLVKFGAASGLFK